MGGAIKVYVGKKRIKPNHFLKHSTLNIEVATTSATNIINQVAENNTQQLLSNNGFDNQSQNDFIRNSTQSLNIQNPQENDIGIENHDMGSFDIDSIGLATASSTLIAEPNHQEYPLPFDYAFKYRIGGSRQTAQNFSDGFQLHTIQDFEFNENSKDISYRSKSVVVGVLLVQFRNGSLIVTACNNCPSYQNLHVFLPAGTCSDIELPSFSSDRFLACKHTASVISELCDHHRIPTRLNLLHKHNLLTTLLNSSTNSVTSGWQNLGPNLLTFRKHLLGCFLTSEFHLLCFNLSKMKNQTMLLCNLCNRRNCSHCKVAEQEEFPESLPETTKPGTNTSRERHILYSTVKYSFDFGGSKGDISPERTSKIREIIWSRSMNGASYFNSQFPDKVLREPRSNLVCCPYQDIGVHKSNQILIFTPAGLIHDFATDIYRCEVCKKSFHLEGHDLALLNFGDSFFFCVELFYSLLDVKYRSGLSTYAWWNSHIEINLRLVAEEKRPKLRDKLQQLSGSINQFFMDFLKLLEYPAGVMKCCGGSPDTITLDGIVMSIESKRIRDANLTQPWITETNFNRQTTRKNRNVLELSAAEKKLIDLYTTQIGVPINDINMLRAEYRRNPVVELMVRSATIVNGNYRCDKILKPFFRSCRKDIMPAISFLPKVLWTSVAGYLDDQIPLFDLFDMFQQDAPALTSLLNYLRLAPADLKPICRNVLRYILLVAKLTEEASPYPQNYSDSNSAFQYSDDGDELMKTGVYFPNNPIIRTCAKTIINGSEKTCTKNYQSAAKLGAGILLFWCAKHRLCIGFLLLESAESCEYVYTTLVTRFKTIPKTIIYDNACNLSEYCMNRAPHLFMDSKFLVDAFHYSGHTNCSYSFNSGLHKSLYGVSSVLHEQKNALLAKSKIPVLFMKYESYAIYLRALVYHMNYLESRKNIEQAAKTMSTLIVQPSTEISAANNSARLFSSNNSQESTNLSLLIEPDQPINLKGDFYDLSSPSPPEKCRNCNSTDNEFDNAINRAVCMGCGGELDNILSPLLEQLNSLELVESM